MRLQHGFSLVEVLVTLLIFKIGLLGALVSQTLAIRQVQDATQRTLAVALSNALLNDLRANQQLAALLGTRIGADAALPALPDCSATANCSTSEIAAAQAHSWLSQLQQYNRLSLQHPQFCLRSLGSNISLNVSWQQKSAQPGAAATECAVGAGRSGFIVQGGG